MIIQSYYDRTDINRTLQSLNVGSLKIMLFAYLQTLKLNPVVSFSKILYFQKNKSPGNSRKSSEVLFERIAHNFSGLSKFFYFYSWSLFIFKNSIVYDIKGCTDIVIGKLEFEAETQFPRREKNVQTISFKMCPPQPSPTFVISKIGLDNQVCGEDSISQQKIKFTNDLLLYVHPPHFPHLLYLKLHLSPSRSFIPSESWELYRRRVILQFKLYL